MILSPSRKPWIAKLKLVECPTVVRLPQGLCFCSRQWSTHRSFPINLPGCGSAREVRVGLAEPPQRGKPFSSLPSLSLGCPAGKRGRVFFLAFCEGNVKFHLSHCWCPRDPSHRCLVWGRGCHLSTTHSPSPSSAFSLCSGTLGLPSLEKKKVSG